MRQQTDIVSKSGGICKQDRSTVYPRYTYDVFWLCQNSIEHISQQERNKKLALTYQTSWPSPNILHKEKQLFIRIYKK